MSWQEIANKQSGKGNEEGRKNEYVQFPAGNCTIKGRILDEQPESRWTHYIPQANGGKGTSIRCIGKGCPTCAAMKEDKVAKRKTKYSSQKSHAINFFVKSVTSNGQTTEVNKTQILDKGNKIFEGLLILLNQMGDLRSYDVTINKTATVGANGKDELGTINYTILPVFPPAQLTPEEATLASSVHYDLAEATKALSAEQITTLMNGGKLEFNDAPASDGEEPQPNVDFTAQHA